MPSAAADSGDNDVRDDVTWITPADVAPLTASTMPGTASRALSPQPLGVYKCGAWHTLYWGANWSVRDCARIATMKEIYDIDYRTEAFNEFYHQSLDWTCKHSETTTWRFSVSSTVKAEAGVIFAKAEASATVGIERELSTTKEASASVPIRPRSYVHCTRGASSYKITGNVRQQEKTSAGEVKWLNGSYKEFSASAPSRTLYKYGPGRL